MTILAVTGLKKEAEMAGIAGVVAVAGGGDAALLAQKLDALHGDIRGVISIGLAGGLSPHLKVGDVVIADQIITGAENWDCHEGWRVRLMSRLPLAHQGQIFGSDIIIENAETKSGLYDATGALAVDMESQVAARFAALGRVLGSLLRHPTQIPSLIRTAQGSNKAFAELLRCLDLCGVGIAGLDL